MFGKEIIINIYVLTDIIRVNSAKFIWNHACACIGMLQGSEKNFGTKELRAKYTSSSRNLYYTLPIVKNMPFDGKHENKPWKGVQHEI